MTAFHFIDGKWVDGNPPVMNIWDHAMWLGAAVFDGARSFEGVAPDLDRHCARAVRSAAALGLRSPLSAGRIEEIIRDGIARFPKDAQLYLRPFLWSTDGWMDPDPASTRIVVSVKDYPMPDPATGMSVIFSKWRRPSFETAPTDAVTFASVALALAISGCLAALLPAMRAARVDPVVALRAE